MAAFVVKRTWQVISSAFCVVSLACAPQAGPSDGGVDSGMPADAGNGPSADAGTATDAGGAADAGVPTGQCEQAISLNCASGNAVFDTANGTNAISGYGSCDPLFDDDYMGKELIFAFTNSEAAKVTIDARKSAMGSTTYRLHLLDSDPCAGAFECIDYQENTLNDAPGPALEFEVGAGETAFLSYDVRIFDETTPLTLRVSCTYPVCGDGTPEGGEACDDGNTASGDGCDSDCNVESGYVCRETDRASDCYEVTCGDGRIDAVGAETCDDGNTEAGDGCSASCAVESAFTCTGEPSACTQGGGTCADPIGLNAGEPLTFSTVGADSAQSSYGSTCSFHDYSGPERVHSIDVPPGQVLRAKVNSSDEFPARVVISDGCGTGMGCETLSVSGAAWVNRSSETQTKYVIVDGWLSSSEGDYTLETDVLAPSELPPGDVCDTAIELTPPQSVTGNTANFVNSVTQYGGQCGFLEFNASRSGAGRDIFYSVRVPAGETLRAELSNVSPGIDVVLALFDQCGDSAGTNCLADVDLNSAGGAGETLIHTNDSGSEQVYIIAVDGISSDAEHTYDFSVSLE